MPQATAHVPNITSQNDIIEYLRDVRNWPIPDDALIDDVTFDWTGDDLRLSKSASQQLSGGTIRQLRPLVADQPWGIFFVEFCDSQIYRTALRQILRGLVPNRRRASQLQAWSHENILFVCASAGCGEITFAHFRGDQFQRAKLATFGWEKGSSFFRTLLEFNLPKLNWPDDPSDHQGWLKQWAKAFDKEPLTRKFFKRFDECLEHIKTDLETYQKLDSAQAYSRAQLLLERLIFLYFLQNRGWLDQTPGYLLANFKPYAGKPTGFDYYTEFLEKLFWTLSSAPGSKDRIAGIPFLNGGLFDDDEFAPTDSRMKNHPPLRVRNSTFAYIFENLLEAFNFTVREDTPLNQDVAVDPEMLGKVFESIVLHAEAADPDAVAPDKRKATGSYYTPRIVVHFICRESLCQYLLARLPQDADWNSRLRSLVEIFALDGLDPDELALLKKLISPAEGRMLLDMIRDLKCLDPSVGSGAFPVGLLHELLNLRQLFGAAANGYVDPVRRSGRQWIHENKAQIVENCLYGVDIQQQAIEICRLRLWLSLVVDYDIGLDPFTAEPSQFRETLKTISQLPNLEMNFRRGDSLLDMVSGIRIRIDSTLVSNQRDLVDKIKALGHDLHKAHKAERKKKLRLEILGKRLSLTEKVLSNELRILEGTEAGITSTFLELTESEKNDSKLIAQQKKQVHNALERIADDRLLVDQLLNEMDSADFYPRLRKLEGADFDSPFNFVWHIDFAEIFAPKPGARRGGFDIIVGNPPFVTARNPEKREMYRARWKRVCHKNYLLVCPFFELSFGLLKPEGQIGFIVSNAFAQRDLGKPLVENFFPTVDLRKVVDCSGLMFPGHGTPTCIVFGAQRVPNDNSPIRVAAILPGGGDLRTPPEESPLWHTLAAQHDNSGFGDNRVVVADRTRNEMRIWPWKFAGRDAMGTEQESSLHLEAICSEPIGAQFITGKDEAYVLTEHCLRRFGIPSNMVRAYGTGEDVRNWAVSPGEFILFPYDQKLAPLSEPLPSPLTRYLKPFKETLENCVISGSIKKKETNLKWFEYRRLARAKFEVALNIINPHIATHCHFLVCDHKIAFKEKALAIALQIEFGEEYLHLLAGWLNSSLLLDCLKRESFNKGAGEDEHRDRFEYAGEKLRALSIPTWLDTALHGTSDALSDRLTALSRSCWERGDILPSLAMRKLFEKPGEAYHDWNTSLPGYVAPHKDSGGTFVTSADLRKCLGMTCSFRDILRRQMIALQEEMDWLVYAAYGLLKPNSTIQNAAWVEKLADDPKFDPKVPQLYEAERPFRLWAAANGDFDKAVALIPADWPADRRALWEGRLTEIRDNEHIRRIEAPVYKRRWDEQWKVSNRWMAGSVAYAQELIDAFRWWLAEKAEWYLEHKSKGGPLALDAWTIALWQDPRIQAAWPVIADALCEVERWKTKSNGKASSRPPEADASAKAFIKFFRETIKDETVPDGIPPAVPWEKLDKTIKGIKQAQKVRGKLNVPRERFREKADGTFIWAGKS